MARIERDGVPLQRGEVVGTQGDGRGPQDALVGVLRHPQVDTADDLRVDLRGVSGDISEGPSSDMKRSEAF
jgi:hypothetical protein